MKVVEKSFACVRNLGETKLLAIAGIVVPEIFFGSLIPRGQQHDRLGHGKRRLLFLCGSNCSQRRNRFEGLRQRNKYVHVKRALSCHNAGPPRVLLSAAIRWELRGVHWLTR